MNATADRRQRLHQLLDLARAARGWTRADLARALQRDPTRLYMDSGNPKLDFVISLAEVLEWPVGELIAALGAESAEENGFAGPGFASLDAETMAAHRAGQYDRMVELAQKLFQAAETPEQRALACNREAGGWDGLGRYPKALDAVRRGLQQGAISQDLRLKLQGNLANAYYTLWDLIPALGVAKVLVEWHEANPAASIEQKKRPAFAYYVRGNTLRRMAAMEPENRKAHCLAAKPDLERSMAMYLDLASDLGNESLAGIANTCRGGLIEIDVELGGRTPEAAIEEILARLDVVVDLEDAPGGDWLESYGWWCIFGGNIALRHLKGRRLQQVMAVFTNKALEIADRLDNWAMRERVFTMQYTLHEVMVEACDFDLEFTIDDEDRRLIAGTMGRFPRFRGVGWRILQTAKLVATN